MATPQVTSGRGAVYGLREVKIFNRAGDTVYIFDAAQELQVTEVLQHAVLPGNDTIVEASSRLTHVELAFTNGKIDFNSMSIFGGYTITTGTVSVASGTGTASANRDVLSGVGGQCFPYFGVRGRVVEAGCTTETHMLIYKCMISSGFSSTLTNGAFFTPNTSAVGIADSTVTISGSNKIYDFMRYSIPAALTTGTGTGLPL
jgi:hypothetical protein